MNRRGFLGSLARVAVLGGVAASAGCTEAATPSGPMTPPRSPEPTAAAGTGLVVTDFADVEGETGDLLVRVTVENRSGEQRTGTVVVTATAGGEETTVSKEVTVASGERTDVTLETSLSYEAFSADGSMRVELV